MWRTIWPYILRGTASDIADMLQNGCRARMRCVVRAAMVRDMTRQFALGLTLTLTVALSACSDGESTKPGGPSTSKAPHRATTLRVPDQYPTVQKAVDAAGEGDTILVSPGVYHEAVTISTGSLTVRGLDRNEVVFDGSFEKDNGFFVAADDVALENFTVRNYTVNGVFVTGDGDPDDPPGTDTA